MWFHEVPRGQPKQLGMTHKKSLVMAMLSNQARVVATVGVVLLLWCAFVCDRYVADKHSQLAGQTPAMYALAGYRPPLEGTLRTLMTAPEAGPSGTRATTVVILLSDNCPYCETELPAWLRIAADLGKIPGSRLLVISAAGTRLATSLFDAARINGLPVTVAVPIDLVAFGRVTGLGGTPRTVVLDRVGRVRMLLRRAGAQSAALATLVGKLNQEG